MHEVRDEHHGRFSNQTLPEYHIVLLSAIRILPDVSIVDITQNKS